ncbi:hypothetical protein [Leucobacter coleopterorum]|uniref:hypothetical protein n=1 Tax=Leucobacter coleopterorum TaxID=2714933 RepID=UPI001FCADB8B|nr:hypothetical protein [Leucobacter coleopterorum]
MRHPVRDVWSACEAHGGAGDGGIRILGDIEGAVCSAEPTNRVDPARAENERTSMVSATIKAASMPIPN